MKSEHPYYKEDFEEYVANKKHEDAEANLFGQECMPVGINDTFMPVSKGDVMAANTNNLKKAQYNIRERFGYLSEADYEDNY